MLSIELTLMRRDGISKEEARELVADAKELLQELLDAGDTEAAENICAEEFGLEPDYLVELL